MPGIAFKSSIYGSGNKITIPLYTGEYSVFGNDKKGYIELYTSGNVTLSSGKYDIHLVGGGSSGKLTGGGAGGKTYYKLKQKVTKGVYPVVVGAGGISSLDGNDGETTSILGMSAAGGKISSTTYSSGASGGSGGGAGGYHQKPSGVSNRYENGSNGGANGSSGLGNYPGTGQGTNTYDFGDSALTLRAGGGGGGAAIFSGITITSNNGKGGAGGNGGGGAGGNIKSLGYNGQEEGQKGADHYGGGGGGGAFVDYTDSTGDTITWKKKGGAGGSGIVIIRWGY